MQNINIEFDYYLIEKDSSYIAAPSLMIDNIIDVQGGRYLYRQQEAEEGTISCLTFRPPFPKQVQMTDCLFIGGREVFSKKIYDVLKKEKIKGLQLVPAMIRSNIGEIYTDYYIANVSQEYAFWDADRSEYGEESNENDKWKIIHSLVLNKDRMTQIPLKDRLVFVTKENSSYVLYHKHIVALILSTKPIGLIFKPITEFWAFSIRATFSKLNLGFTLLNRK